MHPAPRRPILATLLVLPLLLTLGPAQARSTGPRRLQPVDMVVIHSTGGPTCDAATGRVVWVKAGTLDENLAAIAAHPTLGIHYMIDRDGTLRSSIPEDRVGHHVFRYSERSIAIELINDGDGVDPFPPAQLQATVALIQNIARRTGVRRQGIRRHSDLDLGTMACDRTRRRKVDPGPAFPFDEVLDQAFPTR